jgi:hypothetical protein
VEAYDLGVPTPLSSDLDLTVYVRNVNDYEPQFLLDEYNINFTGKMIISLMQWHPITVNFWGHETFICNKTKTKKKLFYKPFNICTKSCKLNR